MSEDKNSACGYTVIIANRVPTFYPENPTLWFKQLESHFYLANITTDTAKSHYAFAHLNQTYAAEVTNIMESPEPLKYEKLKSEVLKHVLMNEELGDKKPSQFMQHLRTLAGSNMSEDYIRLIWASRLPMNTLAIISSQAHLSLEEIAALADRVQDTLTPATVSNHAERFRSCVEELSRQIADLRTNIDRISRERSNRR